ncbi:flagellar basal body-associated FliL family protein [Poseidonocella sp. HB161398]|uniref:flagellar basal body-associated FliL family protein n=1 Tax=Poseidonocella sp. HB161398 TaxID=2320855 RepID=UPI001108746D|nr:flagellar basal body-associated FliL family protein [Poseidonocella sp. HB161398]
MDEEIEPTSIRPFVLAGLATAGILGGGSFGGATLYFMERAKSSLPQEEPSRIDNSRTEDKGVRTYIDIPEIMLTSSRGEMSVNIRLESYIEVRDDKVSKVVAEMPRISDSINTYLRSIEAEEFDRPEFIYVLKIQILRRIQLLFDDGTINDFLISKLLFIP